VRWDIETNPLNNDYKTPDDVRAAVTELATKVAEHNGPDFFRVNNYLTDGSQRPIYFGEIQPRIGASYDVLGDQKTVVFGGAGRYFDRTLFNSGADERYRLQYAVRTFRFCLSGQRPARISYELGLNLIPQREQKFDPGWQTCAHAGQVICKATCRR
jgi:hypothetical protein